MEKKAVKRNILWNTIGNIFYLGCQWLMSVAVVRLSGNYENAGILSLAISITNIFATLALFNVRNYQVSDLQEKYLQSDYIAHRFITCFSATLLCVIFCLINNYDRIASLSIIAYMMMRIIEAFADVFHGFLQKQWRLDIVGKSGVIRGTVLILTFGIAYKLTSILPISLFIMSALMAVAFLLYDVRLTKTMGGLSCRFEKEKLIGITKECLPILGYGFLVNMIVPTARLFIERYHGEEALGYYGSVSTIAVIVQAAAMYVFTPLNGVISKYYTEGNQKEVLRISIKVILMLIVLTSVTIIAGELCGEFVLSLLFGKSILPFVYLLTPTILASGLMGVLWFLGMMLIVMRRIKLLVIGTLIGFCMSIVLSIGLIPQYKFDGANVAVILSLINVNSIYLICSYKEVKEINP